MDKHVKINSSIKDRVDFESLKIIQGDLKELHAKAYLKYKKSILKHGITDPFDVWENEEKELCIVGGTQKKRVLLAMTNEGFSVPKVPINRIEAKSLKEAKHIVFTLASQYGKITTQGLIEEAQSAGFSDLKEIMDEYELPEIDFNKISDEFTKDHTDKDHTNNFKEEKLDHTCPECGHIFSE